MPQTGGSSWCRGGPQPGLLVPPVPAAMFLPLPPPAHSLDPNLIISVPVYEPPFRFPSATRATAPRPLHFIKTCEGRGSGSTQCLTRLQVLGRWRGQQSRPFPSSLLSSEIGVRPDPAFILLESVFLPSASNPEAQHYVLRLCPDVCVRHKVLLRVCWCLWWTGAIVLILYPHFSFPSP